MSRDGDRGSHPESPLPPQVRHAPSLTNSARVSVGGMLLVASRSRAAPALLVLLAVSALQGRAYLPAPEF